MTRTTQSAAPLARPLPRWAAAAGLVGLAILGAAGDAAAEAGDATCTVFEIRATSGEGGIDAELAPLKSRLTKGPFRQWSRFEKLHSHEARLTPLKTRDFKLEPGRLSLQYRGDTGDDDKTRLRISLALFAGKDERVLSHERELNSGDYLIYIDQKLRIAWGDYILALTCAAR